MPNAWWHKHKREKKKKRTPSSSPSLQYAEGGDVAGIPVFPGNAAPAKSDSSPGEGELKRKASLSPSLRSQPHEAINSQLEQQNPTPEASRGSSSSKPPAGEWSTPVKSNGKPSRSVSSSPFLKPGVSPSQAKWLERNAAREAASAGKQSPKSRASPQGTQQGGTWSARQRSPKMSWADMSSPSFGSMSFSPFGAPKETSPMDSARNVPKTCRSPSISPLLKPNRELCMPSPEELPEIRLDTVAESTLDVHSEVLSLSANTTPSRPVRAAGHNEDASKNKKPPLGGVSASASPATRPRSASNSPAIRPLSAAEAEKWKNARSPLISPTLSPALHPISQEQRIAELEAQIQQGGREPTAAEVALAAELLLQQQESQKSLQELQAQLDAERRRAVQAELELSNSKKLREADKTLQQEIIAHEVDKKIAAGKNQSESGDASASGKHSDDCTEHPLQSSWTFWFENPQEDEDEEESQQLESLGSFRTVEDFWKVFATVIKPDAMEPFSHCYAFRDEHMPVRESFPHGGAWKIKLGKDAESALGRCWEEVLMVAVGEQLQQTNLVGVSVSVTPSQDVVEVWMRDSGEDSTDKEEMEKKILALVSSVPLELDSASTTTLAARCLVEYEDHTALKDDLNSLEGVNVNNSWLAALKSPAKPGGVGQRASGLVDKRRSARLSSSLSAASLASLSSVASASSFGDFSARGCHWLSTARVVALIPNVSCHVPYGVDFHSWHDTISLGVFCTIISLT